MSFQGIVAEGDTLIGFRSSLIDGAESSMATDPVMIIEAKIIRSILSITMERKCQSAMFCNVFHWKVPAFSNPERVIYFIGSDLSFELLLYLGQFFKMVGDAGVHRYVYRIYPECKTVARTMRANT